MELLTHCSGHMFHMGNTRLPRRAIFCVPPKEWKESWKQKSSPSFRSQVANFLSTASWSEMCSHPNRKTKDKEITRTDYARKAFPQLRRVDTVKPAFEQRSASFVLQSAPSSLMDAKPGYCESKIPFWKYSITGAREESAEKTENLYQPTE